MFRKLLPLTLVAIALSSVGTAGAKDLANSKGKIEPQINHRYNRGNFVVTIPAVALCDISIVDEALAADEQIDEPEFIWNRSSRTWMKNPRHGLCKAHGKVQNHIRRK